MCKSIDSICSWLDTHIDRFSPSPGIGLDSSTHIKPFGELVLVLYSFSNPKLASMNPEFSKWVGQLGNILHSQAEEFGSEISWEKLPYKVVQDPETGSALILFPAVSVIAGKATSWDYLAADTLSQAGAVNASDPGIAFAWDLAGYGDCHQQAVTHLFGLLNDLPENVSTVVLEKIIQQIFCATKMGFRNIEISAQQFATLENYLQKALELNIRQQNLDMVSKLILCLNWLNSKPNDLHYKGLSLLSDAISTNGFVPGKGQIQPDTDYFDPHYHASLMALAAIGHANLS